MARAGDRAPSCPAPPPIHGDLSSSRVLSLAADADAMRMAAPLMPLAAPVDKGTQVLCAAAGCPAKFLVNRHSQYPSHTPCSSEGFFELRRYGVCKPSLCPEPSSCRPTPVGPISITWKDCTLRQSLRTAYPPTSLSSSAGEMAKDKDMPSKWSPPKASKESSWKSSSSHWKSSHLSRTRMPLPPSSPTATEEIPSLGGPSCLAKSS